MNIQKPRLIIVGSPADDGGVISSLSRQLYDIDQASTAQSLAACLSENIYDLVILDINISDTDNVSLIQTLSLRNNSFYLLVRSETDDQVDTVLALELGADDCVTFSCSPREIKARVRALLRRRKVYSHISTGILKEGANVLAPEISFRGWILYANKCQLLTPAGDVIALTKTESSILVNLFADPGLIKDRSDIIGKGINSSDYDIRSIDVFVSRLRKKIYKHGGYSLIKTVRGRGYQLNTAIPCRP
ncbi:response regulator transcription factor [Sphingomonas sp. CFBP 8765]|uniref:response regulator transcription factor n=1 Tax=Sphingomonas sp. CFBP 8765 TaxID=2775274 RepID=UPI0017872F03|nr:response regulator transcription factor [Sphingomonas sp. CFBP 8765]MBD8472164.1 response regulator transcription factor [Sphingomonas sp. CFBP 8765]